MKKTILLLAFPLALAACGKKGPEADAEALCNKMKEWKKAKDEGKTEEADKIMAEGRKMGDELKEKYKDDEKGMKVMDEKMDACEDEVMGKGE